MYIFTPNTLIKSSEVNANFAEVTNLQTTPVRAVLTSNFFSSTTIAYQDTGLKVTLTSAGNWIIHCDLRFGNASSGGDYGSLRLYNQTTSTAITNSDRLGGYPTAGSQSTIVLTDLVTATTVGEVIRVELKPQQARSVSLLGDTSGYSVMIARRIL